MKRWVGAALLALLLSGCNGEPERARVEPPGDMGWAVCPPTSARAIAVPFRVNETASDFGRGVGVHRLSASTFLWVYAVYEDTLREDRITRANNVDVARDANGTVHVCTRIDLAMPIDVDNEARSYVVGALISARDALPEGRLQVTVNWIGGCACDPLPRGNTTALFE